jgi:hypothetical protein
MRELLPANPRLSVASRSFAMHDPPDDDHHARKVVKR